MTTQLLLHVYCASMVATLTLSWDCRAFVEYPDSSKISRITCNTFFVRRLSLLRELFRESLTHTNIHTGTKEAWLLVGCWSQREKGFADSFHASGVVDSCERSGGGLLLRCSSTKKKLCSAYTYEFVVQLVVEENRLTKFVVRFVIKPQTNETWLAIWAGGGGEGFVNEALAFSVEGLS